MFLGFRFGTRRKWKTANGRKVKIRHMSDRHIANCLDLLYRFEPIGPEDVEILGEQTEFKGYIEAFEGELTRRKKKGVTVSDFDALMDSVEPMTYHGSKVSKFT